MAINIYKIVEAYLIKHGYDGLFNTNGDCACHIKHAGGLFPCGDCYPTACEVGYIKMGCDEECGLGCEWHIVKEKPNGNMKAMCPQCGGEGVVDSGGQNQDGSWVNMPCPECNGAGFLKAEFAKGVLYTDECTNPECGFQNGGFIVGQTSAYKTLEDRGDPRPCVRCGSEVKYKKLGDT